jgi:SAM-dependent methyltransferase
MAELDLSEQWKDDEPLSTRKKLHRMYSINKIDTQEEAICRIGNATSVLDIGCGTGELLVKLRSRGFKGRLKGIDKYEILTAKFSKENNLNIEFEQMDIAKQTESNNWDVGVMVSILVFVPEFRDVIKRYSKICKKIVMVDVGPEAYPRIKVIGKEIEKVFNIKSRTGGIDFNLHDAIIEFMKYYETINIQKLDDAFRFTDAGPIVEYFHTNRGAWIPEPDDKKWKEILEYVRSAAQKEIDAYGVLVEPKPYYVVIAENPAKTVLPYVTYPHQCSRSRFEGQS